MKLLILFKLLTSHPEAPYFEYGWGTWIHWYQYIPALVLCLFFLGLINGFRLAYYRDAANHTATLTLRRDRYSRLFTWSHYNDHVALFLDIWKWRKRKFFWFSSVPVSSFWFWLVLFSLLAKGTKQS